MRMFLGIGIGAILTLQSDNLQIPNIILQGLATGTLLYGLNNIFCLQVK